MSRFGLRSQQFKNVSKVDRSNAIKAHAATSVDHDPVTISHPKLPGQTITLPPLAVLLTERARRSFKEFVSQAWHVLEPGTVFCRNFATDAVCDHAQAVAEGKRPLDQARKLIDDPIRDLIINIPPRHAKPVWEESLVTMGDGRRLPLKEVQVGDVVLTHTGNKQKVTAVHIQGSLPCLEIVTHSGRKTRAAKDHPFLTPEGWVQAQSLDIGQSLALVVPGYDQEEISAKELSLVRLAGYLIGDGCIIKGCSFTQFDQETIDDFCNTVLCSGFSWTKSVVKGRYNVTGGVLEWLRSIDALGTRSGTKSVPEFVLKGGKKAAAEFVAAYFACDGTINKKGNARKDCGISFCSISRELLEGTQHLLLKLGINSRVRDRVHNNNIWVKPGYKFYILEISDRNETAKFLERIPFIGPKFDRLLEWSPPRTRFENHLIADPVIAKNDAGELPCRCLTVENDSSFTSTDFAVHNSMIMAVFFPAWVWINWPEKRFMFLSFSHEFTKRDSRKTRQLMTSDWYQSRWGHIFELSGDSNTLIRFDNSKGGFRYATSFNGQVTGEGADIIVVDDANNMGEIHSKKKRENVTNKWSDVISSRLSDPKTGCRIIIAQRGHGGDLTGYIIDNDKEKTYVHLRLPAEFELKYRCTTRLPWYDPRTQEGQLIDERRFGPKEIARLKADMKSAFNIAAQLQQRPVPLEGGIFEHDWWRYYRRAELPPISNWLESCVSVDMTFGSVKDEASFCVFQAWARVGAKFYLLGQKRGQWKYTKAKKELKAFIRRFHFIYAIYVENKALGPAIMDELMEEDGLSGIIPVDPKNGAGGGDKVARAHSVSPLVEAGNCFLPDPEEEGNEWVTLELLAELDLFPMAANDDQVDTLTQALRKLRGSAAFGTSPEDVEENIWLDVDILAGEKMFDTLDDSYLYPPETPLERHEYSEKLKKQLLVPQSDSFWSF